MRDDEAVSWVLNNMGMLLNDLGKSERAEASFLQGLEIARARGDRAMEGTLLSNYAEGLLAARRWTAAENALERALTIAREGGEPARTAEALKFRGMLEGERGDRATAAGTFAEALGIARTVDDPLLVAEVLREAAELKLSEGDRAGAVTQLTEALNGFERLAATLGAEKTRARLAAINAPASEETIS